MSDDPPDLTQAFTHLLDVARAKYRAVLTTPRAGLEEIAFWDSAPPRPVSLDAQDPELDLLADPDPFPYVQVVDWPEALPGSRLGFFVDGAERSQMVAVADTVPIIVTASAASILRRRKPGRPLELYGTPRASALTVLLPRSDLTEPLWRACTGIGLTVVDTLESARASQLGAPEAITASFDLCRALAHERASALRQELEKQAILRWLDRRHSDLLVVDGEIKHLHLGPDQRRVIGVVKSHQHRFTGDLLTNVLHLPPYCRTHRFASRPLPGNGGPLTASFYLRWRQAPRGADPAFGLLRVETDLDTSMDDANAIAAWLIAEARPSVPTERNGNHLYPIARAERSAKQAVDDVWRSLPRLVFNG